MIDIMSYLAGKMAGGKLKFGTCEGTEKHSHREPGRLPRKERVIDKQMAKKNPDNSYVMRF